VETSKYNLVETALNKTNKVSKFRSKGQGHWERKCKKNRFSRISLSKVDWFYVKIKPKWPRPIYSIHIVEYISPAKMLRFCDNLQSVNIRLGCVSQRPPGCVPTCYYRTLASVNAVAKLIPQRQIDIA